ncbi:Uncharacterized protein Adt_02572 [Abeliophyllum distichum]|uniref:Uncharacterized protein n=1 Tax=Abeliophyllum distichum TaxID=126358 RepID=A0ABD1VW25_9LAMI
MPSGLPPIIDIAHQLHFVPEDVSSKRPININNPDETNELQLYQIKANKGCRFIFDPGDWFWMHVKDLYPFDAGSDSRSNPFEEGVDDAIHDQNKGETKLMDQNADRTQISAGSQKL